MSGGFYLNGREVSDGGPSTSREASARDPLFALKANIADASRENNFEACLGYSDEGLRLSPGSKEFLLMKAKFLVLMHQSDKANELLSEILKLDTQNAEAIATLGLIFYHQGNLNKSIEVFNNALEIDSSLTETKILRDKAMRITRIMQNIPDASSPKENFTISVARTIAEGLLIDPSNREVTKLLRFHQGLGHFKNGRFREVVEAFNELLKLDQSNVDLFITRAKSFMELALHDDAIIDLKEAEVLNNLSPCRKVKNEIEELRKAIGFAYVPKTDYELLGVQRNATDSDLTVAFNSLTILYKVNLNKSSTEAEKRKLEFFYKRVERAFAVLSDKKLRSKYDKILEKQEASIECPSVNCSNCGKCVQISCTGIGDCCTGVGSCFSGFGNCIVDTMCSPPRLQIICGYLNCANIIVATVVLFILHLIFK